MKKSYLILVIIAVAVISSASTVAIMKFLETRGMGDEIIILSDVRCKDCNPERLETSLARTFPEAKIKIVDYSDRKGQKLYKSENLKMLPAVLMPKSYENNEGFKKIQRFVQPGKDYYTLIAGGKFDPTAEICDNEIDDNGNKLVDCADPTCKTNWLCMEKRDKPNVDVFVMSHCPYGTQIEKGLLPVWDRIGDKIDLNIRFVDYAMHGKKEIDEQLKQYCIQKQGMSKYKKYLECFLKDGKPDNKCAETADVDKDKLDKCQEKTDNEFGITKNFNDKSKWKGRFPPFGINAKDSEKYGVRGSPTLVINDVVVQSGRSPKAILDAVCKGFKTPPKECSVAISTDNPTPGFGFGKTKAGKNTQAACGD